VTSPAALLQSLHGYAIASIGKWHLDMGITPANIGPKGRPMKLANRIPTALLLLRKGMVHAYCFLWVAGLAYNAQAEKIPYASSQIKPPTPAWTAKIQKLVPAKPTVPAARRKLLIFSLFTGFKHDVVPHVDRVFQILGKKSGTFDATRAVDLEALTPQGLAAYDVLVLNNN
jgi:hypothetical protein